MQYQSLHLDPRQPIFGHGKSRPTIAQKGALRLISNKRALKPSIQWRATTLRFLCQSSTVTDGSPRQNLRRQEYWTMLSATDPAWLIKTLLASKTRYKLVIRDAGLNFGWFIGDVCTIIFDLSKLASIAKARW